MTYSRPNVQRLAAYVPGEQPNGGDVIKLNTNENPYPPCDAVMAAIASVSPQQLRRYPAPAAQAFREAAARLHGVEPSQIIATNGGDELLRLVLTAFCPVGAGGSVAVAEPSYSLYPVLADIHGTSVTRVELGDAFDLPDDFADRALAADCRVILLVNPHAPSGRLEPLDKLEAIGRRVVGRAVLVVDEAYVDFAQRDALPLLDPSRGLDNVLLLRTLSKGYSLAGLRFGYGIGHADLIATLDKVRDSYNTDALAQAAAVAAVTHRDEAARTWSAVRDQRARLTDELTARGWSVLPSEANFVLTTPGAARGVANADLVRGIYESLKGRGILVRYFDQDRLRDKLRITVGSPGENDALLAALDEIERSR